MNMYQKRKRHKAIDDSSVEALEWLMEQYDITRDEIAVILRDTGRHETDVRTVYRWLSKSSRCPGSIPITVANKLWISGRMTTEQLQHFVRNV